MFPLKRKFFSTIWRLKQFVLGSYTSIIKFFVELLTERYWLLDFLPTLGKKREGVLLIRLDLIGDFILWLDAAQAFRLIYPNQKITLIVNGACAELAESLPHWDEVISVDVPQLRTNYIYRLHILIRLRWRGFSVAIQPTFSREYVGDLLLRGTFASNRIGYEGDSNNLLPSIKCKTDTWYTRIIPNDPSHRMELNINAHLVRTLGCSGFKSRLPVIPSITMLPIPLQFSVPYIVIAPGASWQPKMWPIKNFARLCKQLTTELEVQVLVCGGLGDQKICRELEFLLAPEKITDLSGKTSLVELIEVIRGAALVITNDSAPAHIAAAVLTQAVCIVGGGHPDRFLPYTPEIAAETPTVINRHLDCLGCLWRCKYTTDEHTAVPCIADIPFDEVYDACLLRLKPITSPRTSLAH